MVDLAKKNIALGNKKLTDFAELRNAVISHAAAMKRLKK